jgi:hypothetical protein
VLLAGKEIMRISPSGEGSGCSQRGIFSVFLTES